MGGWGLDLFGDGVEDLSGVADEHSFVDEDATAEFAPRFAEGEVFGGAVWVGGPVVGEVAEFGAFEGADVGAHFLEDAAVDAHEAACGFFDFPEEAGGLAGVFLAGERGERGVEADLALAVEAEDEGFGVLHEGGEVVGGEDEVGVDDHHFLAGAVEEVAGGDVHGVAGIRGGDVAEDGFAPDGGEHGEGPGGDGEAHAVVDDGVEGGGGCHVGGWGWLLILVGSFTESFSCLL